MALNFKDKMALQREAIQIKKELDAGSLSIRDKIAKQKRRVIIIKRLQGRIDDNGNDIVEAANKAATGDNDMPEPTEAQKKAGNYKKGDITLAGIDFRIENPKGSTRSGVSGNGESWSITMQHHYGDIKGTKGADGDAIDVFIGDDTLSEKVFVVDQVDHKGQFDEHKVMFGFSSSAQARKAYLANYKAGWDGLGDITTMSLDKFKKWIAGGVRTTPLGSIAEAEPSFLDKYTSGEFHNLKPSAFKGLVLQAEEEGLTLDDNKEVVKAYIERNKSLFDDSPAIQ